MLKIIEKLSKSFMYHQNEIFPHLHSILNPELAKNVWPTLVWIQEANVFFEKRNTSWEVDLLLPIWLGCCATVVDVSKVTDLFRHFFYNFLFLQQQKIVCIKWQEQKSPPTSNMPFFILLRKQTIIKLQIVTIPTLSTAELFSSVCLYVAPFFLFFSLSRFCWKFHMKRIWYRWRPVNARVCIKFSQTYSLFSQKLMKQLCTISLWFSFFFWSVTAKKKNSVTVGMNGETI